MGTTSSRPRKGLYAVKCEKCNLIYIGETGNFARRIKEHRVAFANHERRTSLENIHSADNHTLDDFKVEFWHNERSRRLRKELKEVAIEYANFKYPHTIINLVGQKDVQVIYKKTDELMTGHGKLSLSKK